MDVFWTKKESEALREATEIIDLAKIGLVILNRMGTANQNIVQVCGPMTTGGAGDLFKNMALFRRAIDIAIEKGLFVFDQLPFQDAMKRIVQWEPHKPYCNAILDDFYKPIFSSGYVKKTLFLPDWQSSHGARWERKFVFEQGLIVEEYPTDWL